MTDAIDGDRYLRMIEASGDYRVLRRLEVREGHTNKGRRDGTSIAVVLDTETTGVGEDDVIIELAMRRIRFDPDGVIVAIDKPYTWLEDPGRELPPDVAKLTGITDADLAGKQIDEGEALGVLNSAEFVQAHNARFDLGMLVRRLPEAADLAWACSQNDIDWRAAGFEGGRPLGQLLSQIGLFHGAHRALDDVDAVIALLGHELPSGRTALAEMVETARAHSWRIRAVGATFEVKDVLKARGYRWDARAKEWCREVRDVPVALLKDAGFTLDDIVHALTPGRGWPDRPGLPTFLHLPATIGPSAGPSFGPIDPPGLAVRLPTGELLRIQVSDQSIEGAVTIRGLTYVSLFGILVVEVRETPEWHTLDIRPGRCLEGSLRDSGLPSQGVDHPRHRAERGHVGRQDCRPDRFAALSAAVGAVSTAH